MKGIPYSQTRRSFIRGMALAGLALTAGCLPGRERSTATHTKENTTMAPSQDSFAILPAAMTRGVEKNGWRILGPGGGGALYIPTIKPGDPDTALVACDMTGAYLTENGGQAWSEINLKALVKAFAFDPANPSVIYAGATGLYRSSDGGHQWQLVFPRPAAVEREMMSGDHADHSYVSKDNWPGGKIEAICVDPRDSQRIYLGINCGTLKLFATQDGGDTWAEVCALSGARFMKSLLADSLLFLLTDAGLSRLEVETAKLERLPGPSNEVLDLSAGKDLSNGQTVLFVTTPGQWQGQFTAGVYCSHDLGQTWQAINNGLEADLGRGQFRRITCIAACAQDARSLYASAVEPQGEGASTDYFGIFKSADMGRTWQWALKIGKTNPSNRAGGWIESDYATDWGGAPFYLSVSPTHPAVCYATDWGTAYRSVDGGVNWSQLYCAVQPGGEVTTLGLDVTNIYWVHFDPFHRDHLALSCTDIGAFHSQDGGKTWRHSLKGVPRPWQNGCYTILFDPQVKGRAWSAWSACHDLPRPKMFKTDLSHFQGGICKSEDALETWSVSSQGLPAVCAATDLLLDHRSPAGGRTLYLAAVGAGVYKSGDDGKTWQASSQGIQGNLNAWRLVQLPDGRLLVLVCRGWQNGKVIDGGLYSSTDQAASWQPVPLPTGVNFPNDLAFDPSDPQRLYLACWPTTLQGEEQWGGLYRSEDGGGTWSNIYNPAAHVYGVAVDPRRPATVFLTTFEGVINRSDDFGQHWQRLGGYNFKWAKQPIPDPYNPDMLYLTTFGSSVWYGPAKGVRDASEEILPPGY